MLRGLSKSELMLFLNTQILLSDIQLIRQAFLASRDED